MSLFVIHVMSIESGAPNRTRRYKRWHKITEVQPKEKTNSEIMIICSLQTLSRDLLDERAQKCKIKNQYSVLDLTFYA